MQEAKVRQEIYRMLGTMGYWPVRGRDTIVCSRCGNHMHPPIGRPDILVLSPKGTNSVVEVKVVNMKRDKAFALDKIRDEQRSWLTSWRQDGGMGFLAIGTVNVRPRRLWLIPWVLWEMIEDALGIDCKKSIPVDLTTYSRSPGVKIDIATKFQDFEMIWNEGQWWLPDNHWLRRHVDATRET